MSVRGIFCWEHTCVSAWYLHLYVAFRKTFACTLERAAKRKIKRREKRAVCSLLSWGNILMISTGEKTDFVLFWLSESERKEAPRARERKRERESSLNAAFDLQAEQGTVAEATDPLRHPPHPLFIPGSARLVSPLLWPQVIGWTSTPAPGAAPVAGLRPARPSRLSPQWICTSTPPPAHASSSPCPWRRPWRDWRGGCRKDSKYQKRDSLCYTKKRE